MFDEHEDDDHAALEAEFAREMQRLYEEPKRAHGYNATYLLHMMEECGPVEAARRLALDATQQDGLTKLWELAALHYSVEAVLLRPRWRALFDTRVRMAARRKLRRLDYHEPEWGEE